MEIFMRLRRGLHRHLSFRAGTWIADVLQASVLSSEAMSQLKEERLDLQAR